MTSAFRLDPEKIRAEAARFTTRLAEGVGRLHDIGVIPAGVTEKTAIYAEDKITLYRYKNPAGKTRRGAPAVLVSYALVNRPYMTDLQVNRSMVRGLLAQGLDVYLIDWGYPDATDRFLTLEDYILGYLDRCADAVRAKSGQKKINLLGICQGGVFSLCYAALHPAKIRNLMTMVTPVDFHTADNMLGNWIRHVDVDRMVDSIGNIPGDMMNWTFLNMKPYRLLAQKYIDMVDILDDAEQVYNFMHMEKWIFDSPDQAAETYRRFVKEFYQQNRLVKGRIVLDGKKVSLKNIKCPVLNIYAEDDHLVPPSAAVPLGKYAGTKDYTALSFKGGHIGIYVSSAAQALVPPAIGRWIADRV